MKKIYLVRHGITEGNVKNEVQGNDDVISEIGLKQAEETALFFQQIPAFRLFSSDLPRARETSEIIGNLNKVNPELRTYLREIRRPSEFEGKKSTNENYRNFLDLADKNVADSKWHFSDEENFFDICKRVEEFFKEMESIDGNVVVVSHARTIMMIILRIIGQEKVSPELWKKAMNSFIVKNGSISTFCFGIGGNHWDFPHWQVESLNYCKHLQG